MKVIARVAALTAVLAAASLAAHAGVPIYTAEEICPSTMEEFEVCYVVPADGIEEDWGPIVGVEAPSEEEWAHTEWGPWHPYFPICPGCTALDCCNNRWDACLTRCETAYYDPNCGICFPSAAELACKGNCTDRRDACADTVQQGRCYLETLAP